MQAIITRLLKNGHAERAQREAEAREALNSVRTAAVQLSEAIRTSTKGIVVNVKTG